MREYRLENGLIAGRVFLLPVAPTWTPAFSFPTPLGRSLSTRARMPLVGAGEAYPLLVLITFPPTVREPLRAPFVAVLTPDRSPSGNSFHRSMLYCDVALPFL